MAPVPSIEELKATYSRELAVYTQQQWNSVHPQPQKKGSADSTGSTGSTESAVSTASDELESSRKSDKPRPHSFDGEP